MCASIRFSLAFFLSCKTPSINCVGLAVRELHIFLTYNYIDSHEIYSPAFDSYKFHKNRTGCYRPNRQKWSMGNVSAFNPTPIPVMKLSLSLTMWIKWNIETRWLKRSKVFQTELTIFHFSALQTRGLRDSCKRSVVCLCVFCLFNEKGTGGLWHCKNLLICKSVYISCYILHYTSSV